MSETDDIRHRLTRSDSVMSLRAEQEVVESFRRLDWWFVEHGPFFRDRTTGKLRELDVRARRSWGSASGAANRHTNLEVLVEVKSLRGYHLVFAPEPHGYRESHAQGHWLGHAEERLARFLTETDVGSDTASKLVTRFKELAYPGGISAVDGLSIGPPSAPVFATAFRETNVGSDKELDASVLWKAIQGLASAVESYKERRAENFYSDLTGSINFARLDGRDIVAAVEPQLQNAVLDVALYHPVVILDARLWLSKGDELEETEHARFIAQEPGQHPLRWFDVVTRRSSAQWINQLTEHYSSQLEHPDEHIWRENSKVLMQLFDWLRDPNQELEVKKRDLKSGEPAERILFKTRRRRRKPLGKPVAPEKAIVKPKRRS